jgi:hypothetical protein
MASEKEEKKLDTPQISFVALSDYANVLTEWSYAINKYTSFRSKCICMKAHPYKYDLKHDYDIHTIDPKTRSDIVVPWFESSDYIMIGNGVCSKSTVIKMIPKDQLKSFNKKISFSIFYYGSRYRKGYEVYNERVSTGYAKRIYAPDLFRLSPKTKYRDYCLFPINNALYEKNRDRIQEIVKNKLAQPKLIILHCPSNGGKYKGTKTILNVIASLINKEPYKSRFKFVNTSKLPHPKILNLLETALIYIDQFNPEIGGYGVSSIESLSSGCITFCSLNNLDPDTYTHNIPLVNISNKESFKQKLEEYMKKTNDELQEILVRDFQSFMTNYSPPKLCELLEKYIFVK